ncbi:hypothetical protein KQX54_016061 [Cotesia glomerata]|uniref:Uncharacterized protein n=1 Tax=Cotesia glomerata TaxID=32391 RepID=A0AAV7HUL7_COTGL|nr:hypothetical protein KQX54_016061 [Cotesia glomerata]
MKRNMVTVSTLEESLATPGNQERRIPRVKKKRRRVPTHRARHYANLQLRIFAPKSCEKVQSVSGTLAISKIFIRSKVRRLSLKKSPRDRYVCRDDIADYQKTRGLYGPKRADPQKVTNEEKKIPGIKNTRKNIYKKEAPALKISAHFAINLAGMVNKGTLEFLGRIGYGMTGSGAQRWERIGGSLASLGLSSSGEIKTGQPPSTFFHSIQIEDRVKTSGPMREWAVCEGIRTRFWNLHAGSAIKPVDTPMTRLVVAGIPKVSPTI